MDGILKYHNDYQSGKITIKEIAKLNNVSSAKVTETFNIRLDNIINSHNTIYAPIIPKLIKTEEENGKKEFLVSDWQTMTEEEKELYL